MNNEYRPEESNHCEGHFGGEPKGGGHPSESGKHQSHDSACISFVHQDVCVEAIVTIKPRVKVGEGADVHCGNCEIKKQPHHPHHHGHPHKHPHKHHHGHHHKVPTPEMMGHWHWDPKPRTSHEEDECSFVVSQELCLMIPLIFSAEAIVKSEKIHCENPDTGSCSCDCDHE